MPIPGERVLIPTEVEPGAFPHEKLVTVDTEEGPVSGFARPDYIIETPEGHYLLAEVKHVSGRSVTVQLFGSFFTTTGLAVISDAPQRLKLAG